MFGARLIVAAIAFGSAVAGDHARTGPNAQTGGGPTAGVVAGSSGKAPPPYWGESFWGVTSAIERAFPFQLVPLGVYEVTELQVAAYHYEQLAGSSASFSVHSDLGDEPGQLLGTFQVTGIGVEPSVVIAGPVTPFTVRSGERYWLVGTTGAGQVNWNLGDNSFGPAAYRVNGSLWVHLSHSNISAFALLGTLSEAQAGDCNGNGQLDVGDWQGLSLCLGGPDAMAAPDCTCADVNRDQSVDLLDVAVVLPEFLP